MIDAIRRGDRDAWVDSWGNATLDPSDIAEPKLQTGGRGNYSGYSNPRVDELLALAARSSDPAAREAAYREVQQIIYDEAPMLFGWVAQDLYAINRRVEGWRPSPDSRINLHDAGEALALEPQGPGSGRAQPCRPWVGGEPLGR